MLCFTKYLYTNQNRSSYHDNFAQVDPQEQQDDSTKGKAVKIRQTYLTTRG